MIEENGRGPSKAPYIVTDVAGHPPHGLDDAVGATTMRIEGDGGRGHRLRGAGERIEDAVLFHDREADSTRDDGGVWRIRRSESGTIVAEPSPQE